MASETSIDLGDATRERSAFFGALSDLGGLGSDEDMGILLDINPRKKKAVAEKYTYPPQEPVDFPGLDGEYKYRVQPNGDFKVIAGPGNVGKTFTARDTGDKAKAFFAIQGEYETWRKKENQKSAQSAKQAKTSKTAGTFVDIFKGVAEGLPGVVSSMKDASADAAASAGSDQGKDEGGGWGALQWGLLAGGIVVAGGVGYLIYRSFSAKE